MKNGKLLDMEEMKRFSYKRYSSKEGEGICLRSINSNWFIKVPHMIVVNVRIILNTLEL